MSRTYEMTIEVEDHDPERTDAVQDAACGEWPFEDWYEHPGRLSANGRSQLCGGESEESFAHRLARAVFKANGGPCAVSVHTTCLEYLPYETYSFDADDPPDPEHSTH